MHNKLLRALFADPAAWRLADDSGPVEQPLPVKRVART
jgi:hypothetical protein